MIRQYGPTVSRAKITQTPRGAMLCGVLSVGTICRPAVNRMTLGRVIIEAWEPRDYTSCDTRAGRYHSKRVAGGHIAHVRDLRTGQRFRLSDAWLLDTDEA